MTDSSEPRLDIRTRIRSGEAADLNRRMRIPPRYRGKILGNLRGLENPAAEAKAVILAGESILITGNPGTGKTHMAVGLMLEWLAENWRESFVFSQEPLPQFVPSVELFLELKHGMDNSASEQSILNRHTGAALLLLDDLGSEKPSEWATTIFYTIIDRRYRDMAPTIITTNFDLEQISERLDDRIASRLVEMGKIIKLEGQDFRLAGIGPGRELQ